MPEDRTGERLEQEVELAGGAKARLNSLLEPGPAISVTVTPIGPVPLYLRRNGTMRRMELTTDRGIHYWVLSAPDYDASVSTALRLPLLDQMDDGRRPIWAVFCDSGDPGVSILAGYLSANGGGSWFAYNARGVRLRPSVTMPEQALLALAYYSEGIPADGLRLR